MEKNILIFFNCQCTCSWLISGEEIGEQEIASCFLKFTVLDANNQRNGVQSPRALGKNYTKHAISRGRKECYVSEKYFLNFCWRCYLGIFG